MLTPTATIVSTKIDSALPVKARPLMTTNANSPAGIVVTRMTTRLSPRVAARLPRIAIMTPE